LRILRGAPFVFVALFVTLVAGCGQPPPEGSEQEGGSTEETTHETTAETTTAAGSEFQGVVDSYAVAHEEIEAEGGEKVVGPYRVGYIVESAEGWWEGDPENLEWREPTPGETNHLEILPFDVETGELVPEAEVRLTILNQEDEPIGSKPLSFYRGEFYHYANNFSVPESGEYTLEAEIEPPTFLRHGAEDGEGKVFTKPVSVEFENVEITVEDE
jgi:Fe2+ transport protein